MATRPWQRVRNVGDTIIVVSTQDQACQVCQSQSINGFRSGPQLLDRLNDSSVIERERQGAPKDHELPSLPQLVVLLHHCMGCNVDIAFREIIYFEKRG